EFNAVSVADELEAPSAFGSFFDADGVEFMELMDVDVDDATIRMRREGAAEVTLTRCENA
ncbi:MAG: hypothetical protein AAGJ87_14080, partial [Pseudomonadota bacterium]